MTKPYLFKRNESSIATYDGVFEASTIAPVRLDAEPTVGQCVWLAGVRYKIDRIDEAESEIWISRPPKGYRDPVNAIGTLSPVAD